jgi:hypothetical protein
MANTDMSRLWIIIILSLFIIGSYTIEGIILGAKDTIEDIDANRDTLIITGESTYPDYLNYTHENIEGSSVDPANLVLGFISFLSFGELGLPLFMQFILSTVMTIIGIVIFYLSYTFVRDWIPFV